MNTINRNTKHLAVLFESTDKQLLFSLEKYLILVIINNKLSSTCSWFNPVSCLSQRKIEAPVSQNYKIQHLRAEHVFNKEWQNSHSPQPTVRSHLSLYPRE